MSSTFNTDSTIGAFEVGVLVSYILFGMTTIQVYTYQTRFPEDDWKLKTFVACVWTGELGLAMCLGNMLYTFTISGYGQPGFIFSTRPIALGISVLFNGLICATIQGFFGYRIYIISRSLYIPALSWFLSLLRLVGNVALFIGGVRSANLDSYEARWTWVATAIWSVSVANDVGIAGASVYLLGKESSRTGNQRCAMTAALVDKIITWTLATGMLTSICSLATLICFVVAKDTFIWIGLYAVGARLFSNSLLASLNSRATLRAIKSDSTPRALQLSVKHEECFPMNIEVHTSITSA